jgi:hypothetical protein
VNRVWKILITTLILVTITINHFAPATFIEEFYYNHIFQAIRSIYSISVFYLPFAFSYLILPIILGIIVWICRKEFQKGYQSLIQSLLLIIGLIYVLFMWLWGFNYKLPSIQQKLQLETISVDSVELIEEIKIVQSKLLTIRAAIQRDTTPISNNLKFETLGKELYQLQGPILNHIGYKCHHPIKVRKLHPAGSLLVFSTTGIYNPFSMEGHLDPGLFHVSYPFTAAHEMAHGYGVTDEGDCNFLALITCINSQNNYIKYSAYFSYYRYLMRDLRQISPHSFYLLGYARPVGFRSDLRMHYASLNEFPEIMPTLRDWIYDHYLKANGVVTGLDSYDRVVALSFAYQKKWGRFI